MKLPIINAKRTEVGRQEMPPQFQEQIRTDLVKRAVQAIEANTRQPYGADPLAGMRASAKLSRRRRKYRGSYGIGISRVPRKIVSRRGTRMNWVGAFAPGTVKGRRAHPPKAEKEWARKINIKERRKAIRSAISATAVKELVADRGHLVPDIYPFVLETGAEKIEKTKEARDMLTTLGLKDELDRVSEKKIRAGRGKMRGRKYKGRKGPLLVVSGACALEKAARNIPGVEVVRVTKLNAKTLAPGIRVGRLAVFTQAAVRKMADEGLFMERKVAAQ